MSSDDLESEQWMSFAMGEFVARFPRDRMYAGNHMWGQTTSDNTWRFGLTAYAVRLLQDVYFLDWIVEPPHEIAHRDQVGSIESKKAESDLFAPVAGVFVAFNPATIEDPSLINAEPYDGGWLIEMQSTGDAKGKLMDPDQYLEHLATAWEVAQRTIKGQVNQ